MKRSVAKYAISFSVAAVLTTVPILGAPLSGAALLERFDTRYITYGAYQQLALLEPSDEGQPDEYYNEEDDEDIVIIIIEDDPAYPAYDEGADEDSVGTGAASSEEPSVSSASISFNEAQNEGAGETPGSDEAAYPETSELSNIPPETLPGLISGMLPEADSEILPGIFPVAGFAITSGINVRSESTFDTARTIVGTAPRGSVIRIDVFGYNSETDAFYKTSGSVLTVGASGSFSSAQQLTLGRNFIRIKAAYYHSESGDTLVSVETAQLNRLPNEVRNQLERGFLLP
ncbi:MAG: hypothetical protein FWD96_00170 [Defluviitaleaceae bacterium]|nr:hypothetical protein [Defluviitaleaceae bacterium]